MLKILPLLFASFLSIHFTVAESVEDLMKELDRTDLNLDERKAVIEKLKLMEAEAAPAALVLISLISDGDLRPLALQGVEKIGEAAVPHIREALKEGSVRMKVNATQALREMGKKHANKVVDDLLQLLEHENAKVRIACAGSLTRLNVPVEALSQIRKIMTKDPTPDVQRHSITIVGKLGEAAREAGPELLELIGSHTNSAVRSRACWALGSIHVDAEKSIPVLLNVLEENDESLQRSAVNALGAFKQNPDNQVVDAMVALLKKVEARSDLSFSLARNLTLFGNAAAPAIPVIEQLIADDPEAFGTDFYKASLEAIKTSSEK